MKNRIAKTTRRHFMKQAAIASAAFTIAPPSVLGRESAQPPSDKLNIAVMGAGGRGGYDMEQCLSENIVALCDVDEKQAAKSFNRFEKVPKYKDFRVMLDKQKDVDAVIVGAPDHVHAVMAINAIQRDKHVYLEKPMAHNLYEVRALMKAASEHKVQTQLGNQGHSSHPIRKVCEWIANGAIGDVEEVHAWYTQSYGDGSDRPKNSPPIPPTLEWDLWIGPAAFRPYHPTYLPGKWRSWRDFGTGVLGDWVCHILDPAFWALQLGAPESIEAKNGGRNYSPERFALNSGILYRFPARGAMPPVKVTWTYGKTVDIPQLRDVKLDDWNSKAGAILIGSKGSIVHSSHGAGNPRIVPESRAKEVPDPPQTIPRIADDNHYRDWIRACKDGKPACSNFSYGGPLTELALLGVIATIYDGVELRWDSIKGRFINHENANRHLQCEYRQGWTL
ncbi:MAG: Gfo/Idh/MocA family oxidoreductase [Candidatus Omnitrophota bacterium]